MVFNIKVFLNKTYDATVSAHDITSKNLSCDSNYILNA